MDIRLKEVFRNEVVLHAVSLLVPLGPAGVWERGEESLWLPQTQTVWLTAGAESIWSEPLINIAGSLKHSMCAVPTLVYIIV